MQNLYECSICGAKVTVTSLGEGVEPKKEYSCEHEGAIIWANRKVTLYGKSYFDGQPIKKTVHKVKMTIRQFICAVTGKNI